MTTCPVLFLTRSCPKDFLVLQAPRNPVLFPPQLNSLPLNSITHLLAQASCDLSHFSQTLAAHHWLPVSAPGARNLLTKCLHSRQHQRSSLSTSSPISHQHKSYVSQRHSSSHYQCNIPPQTLFCLLLDIPGCACTSTDPSCVHTYRQ